MRGWSSNFHNQVHRGGWKRLATTGVHKGNHLIEGIRVGMFHNLTTVLSFSHMIIPGASTEVGSWEEFVCK
jgi:hypothetical protein